MRNLKKILALTLALIMCLALGATAFAYDDDVVADAFVTIMCDGREVYSTSRTSAGSADIRTLGPETLLSLRVNGEDIPLSALEDSLNSARTRYVNGYNATDGTYRIYSETTRNARIAKIYWSGQRMSLTVEAQSGYQDTYQARANAKPAGAVTVSGDGTCSVAAGASWETTFTTVSTKQTIKSLYIMVGSVSREIEVPAYGKMDTSVNNQELVVTRNSDDSVTVSAVRLYSDLSVTAQAYDARYGNLKLNVITDRYISANVASDLYNYNDTPEVIFTPRAGYAVASLRITDGGYVGTLTPNQSSARINGKLYAASLRSDGRLVLAVPAMTNDVTVEATTSMDGYVVEVLGDKYVTSNMPGTNYVPYGGRFSVTFRTGDQTYYTGIEIKTAKGTYTASYLDERIVVDGRSYPITRNIKGDVTLVLDPVPCDMSIAPTSREVRPGYNKIAATTDNYVKSNAYDTWVYNGEDTSVTFVLKDDAQKDTIQQIRLTYSGKTYYANPVEDEYIQVGSLRWDIDVDDDGCVTVTMTNVRGDVDIYASVTKKGDANNAGHNAGANYKITKTTDSHSTVTWTGKAPFDDGDETTVRAYTDNKYILKSVTFTMSGKTATVVPFDEKFTLNGTVYDIVWKTNGDMSVKFDTLTSNLSVKAVAVKGDLKDYAPAVTQTPTEPVQPTQPEPPVTVTPPDNTPSMPEPPQMQSYHAAFMYGFGDGTFRPDKLMTRAEALAVLGRMHGGLNDESAKGYATAAGFMDVQPGEWYAGYVGYAKQQGYLKNVLGAGAANFNPNQAITRAEFVVLLCNFTNQNLVGTANVQVFQDVDGGHWAYTYINYCAARGWALGYDDNMFHPDEGLTRAQICALLNRINNRFAGNTSGYMANQFLDVASTAWYFNDVMEATNEHYVASTSNGVEVWAN